MAFPDTSFLIDTCFHVAFKLKNEDKHTDANLIIQEIRNNCRDCRFYTTDHIITETVNHIISTDPLVPTTKRDLLNIAVELTKEINEACYILKPAQHDDIWNASQELFYKASEKNLGWSLTDCLTLEAMRLLRKSKFGGERLNQILTFDGHFEEAKQYFKEYDFLKIIAIDNIDSVQGY